METQACKAGVAKLGYARDLGSRGRETVRVRIPPSAPSKGKSSLLNKGPKDRIVEGINDESKCRRYQRSQEESLC